MACEPRRLQLGALLLMLSTASSCALKSEFVDPRSGLERGLHVVELDNAKTQHPISSQSVTSREVVRVPVAAVVDESSDLVVHVDGASIVPVDSAAGGAELQALRHQIDGLQVVLTQFTDFLNARSRARGAFERLLAARESSSVAGRTALVRFLAERDAFDRASRDLSEALLKTFADPAKEEALNEVLDFTTDMRPASAFVETELVAAHRRVHEIEATLKRTGYSLRLEAWIAPARAGAVSNLHLEHYDRLDRGEVVRVDALGLNLSPEDRAALIALVQSTDALRSTLSRYQQGAIDYRTALAEGVPILHARLDPVIARADSILTQLRRDSLRARRDQWRAHAATFAAASRSVMAGAVAAHVDSLSREADALFNRFADEQPQLVAAIELISRARDFGRPGIEPDAFAKWLLEVKPTLTQLPTARTLFQSIHQKSSQTLTRCDELIARLPADLQLQLARLWRDSELRADMAQLHELGNAAATLIGDAHALLDQFGPVGPANPSTLESSTPVPLAEAKDTRIELRRTRRQAGDRVFLRATLLRNDAQIDQAKLGFALQQRGWSARLVPVVAVAFPYRPASIRNDGRWTTTLGWLWSYGARGSGSAATLNSTLQPELGLHAAFIGFRDGTDRDLGLGIAAALWRGRLSCGFGRNLLVRSPRDGGSYAYVGTDLVSILQQLGLRASSSETTSGEVTGRD